MIVRMNEERKVRAKEEESPLFEIVLTSVPME
jgi:hypothetical protein